MYPASRQKTLQEKQQETRQVIRLENYQELGIKVFKKSSKEQGKNVSKKVARNKERACRGSSKELGMNAGKKRCKELGKRAWQKGGKNRKEVTKN